MNRVQRREEWRERVEAFKASGQSMTEFCRSNGLNPRQMYYWCRQMSPVSGSVQWFPVNVRNESVSEDSLFIRIGKASVEVKPGFNPVLFATVIRKLQELC